MKVCVGVNRVVGRSVRCVRNSTCKELEMDNVAMS